jgi:CxxC motif-containing protein
MGCEIQVTRDAGGLKVQGHVCKRGQEYAQTETTEPRRVVTTSVAVKGGSHPLASVRTASPIPKAKIFECVDALRNVLVHAPVKMGQVIVSNVVGTGVAMVVTRAVETRPQQTHGGVRRAKRKKTKSG